MRTPAQYARITNPFSHVAVLTVTVLASPFFASQTAYGQPIKVEQLVKQEHDKDNNTVTLRRTKFGVVHVKATDYQGVGYGVGYAYTEDNRCLLAHRIAEVNGRLSEQLGADAPVTSEVHDITATALQSDHYYRGWFDLDTIRAGFAAGAPEVRQLAEGYAKGVNRFLADHPKAKDCPVEFKGTVSVDDVYRMWVATATVSSGETVISMLPHTVPPTGLPANSANSKKIKTLPSSTVSRPLGTRLPSVGSNAWAIGEEGMQWGQNKSVHLYNPHFPWEGIQRLYMIHVTIPGELDVMGVTLGGFPIPLAGFTQDIAWGLTFSPAARWSLADLKLEDNPMTYKVDGVHKQITHETLSIPVLGEETPREIPFFRTEEGPLLDADAFFFGWWDDPQNPGRAYAAHDANADNTRIVEQFLHIAQAKNVRELRSELESIQGAPWSYVVASDAEGEVFFGDISTMPGLSTADIARCVVTAIGALHLPHGIIVLDGTRSECQWDQRMVAANQPQTIRSDYVANSNNTYELPNPAERLTGFSPILGGEGKALSLRANLGLHMIADRLTGEDQLGLPGFSGRLAHKTFQKKRNRGAELLVEGLVADFKTHPSGEYNGATVDLTEACAVLEQWDQRNESASRGAALFHGLWMLLPELKIPHSALFQIPASLDKPLTTPSGYTTDPVIRKTVRDALARVIVTLADKGIATDVRWGDVNKVLTPSGSWAMPGGSSSEGIFDATISSDAFYTFDGWSNTLEGNVANHLYGASYLHSVELGKNRVPRAKGLLPYGQSTDPDSPWYLDQTQRWSENRWFRFPFTEGQIKADQALTVMELKRPQ